MSKPEEFMMPAWSGDLQSMAEQMKSGPMIMSRIGQVASKTGQAIAARQTQHLTEVMADVSVLLRDAMPKANDPAAPARAYAAFLQAGIRRHMSLIGFYTETITGMAQHLMPASSGDPAPDHHDHVVTHMQAPKPNGRAVQANS